MNEILDAHRRSASVMADRQPAPIDVPEHRVLAAAITNPLSLSNGRVVEQHGAEMEREF
jgi:hypothetical protein